MALRPGRRAGHAQAGARQGRQHLVDDGADRAAGLRALRRLEGGNRRTRALARELGPHGICVNTLTPDYIAFDRDYDNRQPDAAPTLAAQRIFAREQVPEDMVGALLFLLGPGSDFVTGQNIWVNGGRGLA